MAEGATSLLAVFAGTLACTGAFSCNRDFDQYGGIVLWVLLMVYMFKALGTICDEYFVPSLEVIVEKLRLSNDVAGATFMAAGSSAPEFFTSLVATFLIVNEGGVGAIVGSAIFNILVIVGATAYVACREQHLMIWWYPLARDSTFYTISIIELLVIISDEHVKWYEGVIMFFTYVLYCCYMKVNPMIVERLGISPDAGSDVQDMSTTKLGKDDEKQDVEDQLRAGGASAEGAPGPPGTQERSPSLLEPAINAVTAQQPQQPLKTSLSCTSTNSLKPVGKRGSDASQKSNRSDKALEVPRRGSVDHPVVSWSLREYNQTHGHHHHHHHHHHGGHSHDRPQSPTRVSTGEKVESAPQKHVPHHSASMTTHEGGEGLPDELAGDEASGDGSSRSSEGESSWIKDPLVLLWETTMPSAANHHWILFTLSILWIGLCTYLMVDATNRVGMILHIPTLVMALLFLAAGTSIPDALASIAVAKQGEGDMAIANALGSNVFDILIGLGVPWTIKCAMGKEVSFEGKFKELIWDIIILCGVLVLFVGALVFNRWRLTRSVGIALLLLYVLFVIYNVLAVWAFELKENDE